MSTSQKALHGKIALVSGSSSGIGAAIAEELAARGATVIINYPHPSEEPSAKEVLSKISNNDRAESLMVQADLATTDGPGILADVISVKFGKLDILVNNAGRNAFCDIATATDAEVNKLWDDIVGVNGRGTLLLTRAVLPILSPANSRIINIGSISSRDPDPNLSIYAGTKGMIESFTRCWARDFPRRYRCTVNTVAPGPVATEKLLAAPESYSGILREKWDRTPAAARFAKQEEVAWVVAELCDEKASWVNGAYIPVTGGATLS